MPSADRLLVDTNVLLEATDAARRFHRDALTLIESRAGLVIAAQIVREYLAVATRPTGANGLGLSTADALQNVLEFRRRLRLLPEERPVLPTFLGLLRDVPCRGKRVHDAHIAATAIVHRVGTIVTLNGDDLSAFTDRVGTVTPQQALDGPARRLRASARPRRPGAR
jgi:predicted nucleic acid-binding protein